MSRNCNENVSTETSRKKKRKQKSKILPISTDVRKYLTKGVRAKRGTYQTEFMVGEIQSTPQVASRIAYMVDPGSYLTRKKLLNAIQYDDQIDSDSDSEPSSLINKDEYRDLNRYSVKFDDNGEVQLVPMEVKQVVNAVQEADDVVINIDTANDHFAFRIGENRRKIEVPPVRVSITKLKDELIETFRSKKQRANYDSTFNKEIVKLSLQGGRETKRRRIDSDSSVEKREVETPTTEEVSPSEFISDRDIVPNPVTQKPTITFHAFADENDEDSSMFVIDEDASYEMPLAAEASSESLIAPDESYQMPVSPECPEAAENSPPPETAETSTAPEATESSTAPAMDEDSSSVDLSLGLNSPHSLLSLSPPASPTNFSPIHRQPEASMNTSPAKEGWLDLSLFDFDLSSDTEQNFF